MQKKENKAKETMCAMAGKKGMFPELKEAAKNAKYICVCCGRVAAEKERICCPPEDLYAKDKNSRSKKEMRMKKIIAVFALITPLVFAGAAFAQEGHAGHKSAAMTGTAEQPKSAGKQRKGKTEKAVLRKVTAEEVGKEAVCPVTGEELTVKEDTGSASYKGRIYYFCCPGCDKAFLAKPDKYVNKKQAVSKTYVCPMGCAQSDKPGKCPKCGMNLVEKQAPQSKTYVCPMGCAQSDKPGKCPKCGMDLVEKK